MNIVLVMVVSLNAKITNGSDSHIESWTSQEDKNHFYALLSKYPVTVMGRSTYEAIRDGIKPDSKRRRIILTSTPDMYQHEEIKNQIEFSSESPESLVSRLKKEGYSDIVLVGGAETNKTFLEAGCVNELFITIEPKLFGAGKNIFADGTFEYDLQLLSVKTLNKRGTLLLHYHLIS